MSTSNDTKALLETVARNTLDTFEFIATEASAKLSEQSTSPANALANVNTLTSEEAIRKIVEISDENRTNLQHLLKNPAIARVVAVDDENHLHTYFICRKSPAAIQFDDIELASYRSPVGRIASLPVREELQLPNGKVLKVVERAELHPILVGQDWDSENSLVQGENYDSHTVISLRDLLSTVPSEQSGDRLLEMLLEEESESANVVVGIRRTVLTRMELRDQPVLDKFQDGIFRMPLNSCLLLLGPPGTGKTTTLIRRLGQKLDVETLGPNEQLLIQNLNESSAFPHKESWMMFTPTSLLQQYVKESFSLEGVPASDNHVRTWADYKLYVARNVFGLLSTSTKKSGFVLKGSVNYLTDDALNNLTSWFDDFETWQKSYYIERLRKSAKELSINDDDRIAELGESLLALLESDDHTNIDRILRRLRGKISEAREIAIELKSEIDRSIRYALNLQVNLNRKFLDELATFLNSLSENIDSEVDEGDIGEEEEDEDDDDEQEKTPRIGRKRAELAYRRVLRTQSRAVASGRSLRKGTITASVIDWISDRGLKSEEQMEVGKSLLLQAKLRTFVNPVKLYIDGIPTRYRSYRHVCQSDKGWYQNIKIRRTDIHSLELDMLLLSILRGARSLFSSREVVRELQDPYWSALLPVYHSYKNQIFVDEATDFSAIQLSCMSALSHPLTNSFFACGDFHQRLSSWGTRSIIDIKWANPKIDIEKVSVGYRQSRELNKFSRKIVQLAGETDYDVVLPQHADREGFPPVLVENIHNNVDAGKWIADRVKEIENIVNLLPSIAILVPEEEQVGPVARTLGEALTEQNINVVACHNGQALGQENDIRVFDVQHIKGLEFEAVFFKDADRLAELYPDLYDKFLYVGSTRAATYLGVTCLGTLPFAISDLRTLFSPDWKETSRSVA